MTKEEAISYLQQLYPNGGHCWLDEQRIEAIGMAINALQEEPVSEDICNQCEAHNDKDKCDELVFGHKCPIVTNGDLDEAGKEWLRPQLDKSYANYGEVKMMELTHFDGYAMLDAIEFGAKWQKNHLWKSADGDDLPDIDREVVALLNNGKVVFAHRPPEYWDGKNIITGNVTRHYPKTYDKGGWNISNVKWWLDVKLLKEIEL